jgi:hypothetical protein
MNYAEIITEEVEELQQLLKQQKAARYEKRVRFLYLLKTTQAKTQKAAGEQVGWKLRKRRRFGSSIGRRDWRLFWRSRARTVWGIYRVWRSPDYYAI